MQAFVYDGHPWRVVFGAGTLAQLPVELDRIGARRALLLSTPGQRANVRAAADALGARVAGVFDRAVMHVPVEVAEDARRTAREVNADCCVTVGGGSTTGLGKAVALTSDLPVISVPTTYSGSEMTPIYGLTEGGLKRTGRDARVLPKAVIYDPLLTLGLPLAVSLASGMNAVAHCAEALYAHDGNPITSLMAEEGMCATLRALPALRRDPADADARSDALYGAWLSGVALATASVGLHHKLCHTLGGTFNLPHAETHSIVLPHALAYNAAHAVEAMRRMGRAIGAARECAPPAPHEVPGVLHDIERELGMTLALGALGMPAEGLERAAQLATLTPYPNPRGLEQDVLLSLLRDAHAGRRPR